MHLKRLEIQGFKTFSQRTVLEFRPGITAIVGPNGSGKSNIADAVRWVLGEQSFAALRCKRTEELLFSGGGRRMPAGLAEVSLTIDNSDRLLALDFDEVTITRRATRDGDNEYFINRARVRLRDVQAATEPLGGSYTIVNQGLVDAALTLRPEERRRLFEDAAEIGGYELRKQEAERRLRETDGNIQRLYDLLSELEPRMRSLKRQATQARQHRELSAELQALRGRWYAAQWRALQAGLTAADAAFNQTAAALAASRNAQTAAGNALRDLRERLRSRREHLGGLHQQSSALHRQAQILQRDLAVGEERLAALNRRAADLERGRHEIEVRRQEAERDLSAAAAEQVAAEQRLAAHEAEQAAAANANAEREAARQALERDLTAAQDAALAATAAVVEQRGRIEQLQNRRGRLIHEQNELAAALQAAAGRLQATQEQLAAAEQAATAAAADHGAARDALEQLRGELDQLRNERSAADERLAAARRGLADVEARSDSLSRLARSYAGAFAGVKTAMQWAERSGRQGFALVSAIVRTPAELETAIEVALGSRLQNIVVPAWQDAEAAIAELKRSGAGRATFLPLDTIRAGGERTPPGPGSADVLGVAADLVDYDPQYAAVVRQLLGRTLVVRDLATARRELARLSGGWTIVTLSGEQASSGGAVTGGAQTKESGTLRRERELRELPQQLAAARERIAALEHERRGLEEYIAATQHQRHAAEQQVREAAQLRDAQQAALAAAQQQLVQATREQEWQAQRGAGLERDLAALADADAELQPALVAAEQQAAAAEQSLVAARARREHERARDQESQVRLAELGAVVAAASSDLRARRTLLATHQQALERLTQQAAAAERDQTSMAGERERIAVAHDQATATHAALLAEIDTLRSQIEPAEAELQAGEERLAGLEAQETAATAALLEHETAHNRAALEAQRARDRLDNLGERAVSDGIDIAAADWQTAAAAETSTTADDSELQAAIQSLSARIERIGVVNPLALEEYDEVADRHSFMSEQLADLRQASTTLRELIAELETAMSERFGATFTAVAAEFERSFARLFGGGTGRLLLLSSGERVENEAESVPVETNGRRPQGVEIVARPPGKRQQNISLLSGGERALTAAALLFAILRVNPSPFCILDEVDAALDESNVGRFREALSELTAGTQFILITHNRGTIEAADTLYGVTMNEDGASRLLSLRVEEFVAA